MFNSLTSLFFGSTKKSETNSEIAATAKPTELREEGDTSDNLIVIDNFIDVTSLAPSVRIASKKARGKNKRRNARQQNIRKGITTATTDEEDFEEDGWFIIKKQELQPTGNDSEEENLPQERSQRHNNLHSHNSGPPRPQKKRNFSKKSPKTANNCPSNDLSVSKLSSSRTVNGGYDGSKHEVLADAGPTGLTSSQIEDGCSGSKIEALADAGITGSLNSQIDEHEALADADISSSINSQLEDDCSNSEHEPNAMAFAACTYAEVAALAVAGNTCFPISDIEERLSKSVSGLDSDADMAESWLMTPPPCFTSTEPINMEISPFENLLIEHPSMSVYHKIEMSQEVIETKLPKLDTAVNDAAKTKNVNETSCKKNSQAVKTRNSNTIIRSIHKNVQKLKDHILGEDTTQKIKTKQNRQDRCRSALKRANKARDVQSRNHIQRRSDLQHCKYHSNANNNRKTNCY